VHPCGTGRCGSIGISPPPEFDKAVIWMSVDGNIGNRISYVRLARLEGLRERVKKFDTRRMAWGRAVRGESS
jgi:hypothetical protein